MPDSPKNLDVTRLIGSLANIFKAVPTDKLSDLNDALTINDMFNERGGEHKNPSRAEIETGPAMAMRGGQAETIVNRNSDFASQGGLTRQYEQFERILSDMEKSYNRKFAALGGVVADMVKGQQGVAEAIQQFITEAQKSQAAAPAGDTFFGKAQQKFQKARTAFRKSEMDEDETEREERKSRLSEVAEMLKSALKLVSKADDEGEKHDEEEVEKAVSAIKTLKGRVDAALAAIKAEEDREEEAAEKARQAEATKKAEDEAKEREEAEKARQAAGGTTSKSSEASTDDEKEDDTAKAMASLQEQINGVQKALNDGLGVQNTTLQQMMETIAGVSKNVVTPPTMVSMKAAPVADAATRVNNAITNGMLDDPDHANVASTLLARSRAADAGQYPRENLMRDIAQAPDAVRQLFTA